jgi:hypothetical protein
MRVLRTRATDLFGAGIMYTLGLVNLGFVALELIGRDMPKAGTVIRSSALSN